MEVGESLAAREPRLVDVDNFESVCRKWNTTLRLPVGAAGALVEVKTESLDDFHPDQLYSKLSIFGELAALRRRLKSNSTFAAAAKEIQSWPGFKVPPAAPASPPKSRGTEMPSGKLSDFARLIGQKRKSCPRASRPPTSSSSKSWRRMSFRQPTLIGRRWSRPRRRGAVGHDAPHSPPSRLPGPRGALAFRRPAHSRAGNQQ